MRRQRLLPLITGRHGFESRRRLDGGVDQRPRSPWPGNGPVSVAALISEGASTPPVPVRWRRLLLWQIDPLSGLAVSIPRHRHQSRSRKCGVVHNLRDIPDGKIVLSVVVGPARVVRALPGAKVTVTSSAKQVRRRLRSREARPHHLPGAQTTDTSGIYRSGVRVPPGSSGSSVGRAIEISPSSTSELGYVAWPCLPA